MTTKGLKNERFKKTTITTLEVAEMMEVPHSDLLKKLEGRKDRKGYIQIMTEGQMSVSDYFIHLPTKVHNKIALRKQGWGLLTQQSINNFVELFDRDSPGKVKIFVMVNFSGDIFFKCFSSLPIYFR